MIGLVGLPVFTMGGGPGYVLQPSFGFLLGLIPAAWVVGVLAGREGRFRRVFSACAAGLGGAHLVGLPYMYLIMNLSGQSPALLRRGMDGMAVYLPGTFIKLLAVAVSALPLVRRWGATGPGKHKGGPCPIYIG